MMAKIEWRKVEAEVSKVEYYIQGPRSNKWKLGNVLKGKKEHKKKEKYNFFVEAINGNKRLFYFR